MAELSLDKVLNEGIVVDRRWLSSKGFERTAVDYYVRAGKLIACGYGAYRKPGPPLKWQNIVYSLGRLGVELHVGNISALSYNGYEHFLHLNAAKEITVYSQQQLPSWTMGLSDVSFKRVANNPFETDTKVGLEYVPFGTWDWPIPYASTERAFVELFSSLKTSDDIRSAMMMFESAATLRPKTIQILLEECKQVKAKRLFLWMGKQLKHSWYELIDQKRIDLGTGKRQIIKNGVLDKEFLITVPKELSHGQAEPLF